MGANRWVQTTLERGVGERCDPEGKGEDSSHQVFGKSSS